MSNVSIIYPHINQTDEYFLAWCKIWSNKLRAIVRHAHQLKEEDNVTVIYIASPIDEWVGLYSPYYFKVLEETIDKFDPRIYILDDIDRINKNHLINIVKNVRGTYKNKFDNKKIEKAINEAQSFNMYDFSRNHIFIADQFSLPYIKQIDSVKLWSGDIDYDVLEDIMANITSDETRRITFALGGTWFRDRYKEDYKEHMNNTEFAYKYVDLCEKIANRYAGGKYTICPPIPSYNTSINKALDTALNQFYAGITSKANSVFSLREKYYKEDSKTKFIEEIPAINSRQDVMNPDYFYENLPKKIRNDYYYEYEAQE